MKIHSLNTGYFKLDGGAMFGVVPKSLWQKKNQSDSDNLCTWAMRCLLIEDENRLILVDTGMGNKQDEKFRGYYQPREQRTFEVALSSFDFHALDITDVILSHLHFDHCGGAVKWNDDRTKFEMTFPNAKYWSHSEHFNSAIHPNPREKATFFKDNILPIQQANQLFFVDKVTEKPFQNIEFLLADGHTEKMLMPKISTQNKEILFIADTIPSSAHIPVPYVMGYDINPLITMKEKENLISQAAENEWVMFFDHDPLYDCATIQKTEKGYVLKEKGSLIEFF